MLDKLNQDIKAALLSGDKELVQTLKFLKSVLLKQAIDSGEELSEEAATKLMQKESKKRTEAAEMYKKGGNEERAASELAEKEIIEKYLPEQMGDDEIKQLIEDVIAELGDEAQNRGKVIQTVIAKSKGQADGGVAARLVNEALSK